MTEAEMLENGIQDHYCKGIYVASFEDGSWINYDLCSGTINYYDDVTWHDKEDNEWITFDCSYDIDSFDVEINGNTYKVVINIV